MAYRAKELTLENVNRVFMIIQKDMTHVTAAALPSGDQVYTVDLAPFTGALDSIIVRVGALEAADTEIQDALDLKALKANTVNGKAIGGNPVLDGTDLLLGNGETDTLYDAIKAAQAIFNITGAANTYGTLPDPATIPEGDVYVVLQDETHGYTQTLYRRTAAGQWQFTGVFSINLSAYYTKGQSDTLLEQNSLQDNAYADARVAAEAQARDSAIDSVHGTITRETGNAISASAQAVTNSLLQTISFQLSNYVPSGRKVNGKALYSDITIDTTNIDYNGQTLFQYLGLLSGSLLYKGGVPTEADLPNPAGVPNGWIYLIEDTGVLKISADGVWENFGRFAVNLADYYTKAETYSTGQVDSSVAAAAANAVIQSRNYTDDRLDNDVFPSLRQYTDTAVETLKQYTDINKLDKNFPYPLVNDVTYTSSPDGVAVNLTRYYLNGSTLPKSVNGPMVSDVMAGYMPASDHTTISNLVRRVESLEHHGVYIGRTFPTYADMIGTPIDPDWTENDYTYVDDDESQGDHRTMYILVLVSGALQWDFAFIVEADIPIFTNYLPGLIKGTTLDGFVRANNDGTGDVYGWAALKTRVTNAETAITTLQNRFVTDVPVTATVAGNAVSLWQKAAQIANATSLANTTYVTSAISAHAALTAYANGVAHVGVSSGNGLSINSSGYISHTTGEGYSHLPSGGSYNQILQKGSVSGTYVWGNLPTTLPNPYSLQIYLSSTQLASYNGQSSVSLILPRVQAQIT